MSQRLAKVKELLRQELGMLLHKDVDFQGSLVTVTEVDITPDLKHAFVFLGVIGNGMREERVLEKVRESRATLQKHLAKRIVLRNTPHLTFRLDSSAERGVRLNQLMDDLEIPEEPEIQYPET